MEERPVLHVYKGEWGLPSIDFECICAMCLVKFSSAPIDINTSGQPFLSGVGKLPYLVSKRKKYHGYKNITLFLKNEGYISKNSDDSYHLDAAYEALAFDKLHPYFYYTLFGEQQNIDITRALYAKRITFPFNFYYPGKYIKDADKVTQVLAGASVYEKIDSHTRDQIIFNAKQGLNILSKKLGNKKYFFGDKCSNFDAILYGYCSILYYITLPMNPLQSHIRDCTNIAKYIDRITKEFFSAESYSSKSNQQKGDNKSNSSTILTPSEQEFLANRRKTQILSALIAFLAMGGYAAWTGILKLSSNAAQYDDHFAYEENEELPNEN